MKETVAVHEGGLWLHEPLHSLAANRQPRHQELHSDQQAHGQHAFGECDVRGQQHRGERGPQRDSDDEVERVEFCQGALSGHAKQREEREIGAQADDQNAHQAAPVVEEHVTPSGLVPCGLGE